MNFKPADLLLILSFLLFISTALAQDSFEKILTSALYPANIKLDSLFNPDLRKGLKVLDAKMDSIVESSPSNFEPARYTIIESREIGVFEPMQEIEYASETAFLSLPVAGYFFNGSKSFADVWYDVDGDIEEYISRVLEVQGRSRGIFHPYHLKLEGNDLLVFKNNIKPNILNRNVRFKHMVYPTKYMQSKLKEKFDTILDSDEREQFLRYMTSSVDNIDAGDLFVTPQAIRISYFFKLNGVLNFGVDIYGTHYLIGINGQRESIIYLKKKWVY